MSTTTTGIPKDKIGRRWAVVNALQRGQERLSSVARDTGESLRFVKRWWERFATTGNVNDAPKQGRPPLLQEEHVKFVLREARSKDVFSSQQLANMLQAKYEVKVSSKTLTRKLKMGGLAYKLKPLAPLLLPRHYAARVSFATANKPRSWRGVLFSDSKYFYTHPVKRGRGLKVWQHHNDERVQAMPQHCTAVHVYMGVSYYGTTSLVFVTGTTGQKCAFVNPKTKKPYDGVSGKEYREIVVPALCSDASKLFKNSSHWCDQWVFQQDGAPCHRAGLTRKEIEQRCPGGLLPRWPASSPDLSWIETVWAWMERQLRMHPTCKDVEELKSAVLAIHKSIPISFLRNCVNGMNGRMTEVVAREGKCLQY